jgi:competence protein ComFC
MKKSLSIFFDIFLPKRCALCHKDCEHLLLCEACLSLCHQCPTGSFIFEKDQIGAFFFYECSVRDLLKGAKFNNNIVHAHLLFKLLRKELSDNSYIKRLKDFAPSAVAYVPTHWLRRSWRGLDIASSVAQIIADYLNIPVIHALKKTTFKAPQSSIKNKKERIAAVENLFILKENKSYYNKLLLVDDIVTTGSTLTECKKILKPLSKNIICLALAKTP